MANNDVQLGATYRDRVSGWTGIATARYEYMNGCVRVEISAVKSPTDPEPTGYVFDSQQIEYVDAGLTAIAAEKTERTGGPPRRTPVAR